jgi:hypothetical protein
MACRFARAYQHAIQVKLQKKNTAQICAKKLARINITNAEFPPNFPRLEQLLPKRAISVAQACEIGTHDAQLECGERHAHAHTRCSKAMWIVPQEILGHEALKEPQPPNSSNCNCSSSNCNCGFVTQSSRQDCPGSGYMYAIPADKRASRVHLRELYERKFGRLSPNESKRLREVRAMVAAFAAKIASERGQGAWC